MSIIAKFTCTSVSEYEYGDDVTFDAVHPKTCLPDDPNLSWSEATPSGSLSMTISNPAAKGFFKVGKDYLLRFEESDQ